MENSVGATEKPQPHALKGWLIRSKARAHILRLTVLTLLGSALLGINLLWLLQTAQFRSFYFFWLFNSQVVIHLIACALVVRYDLGRRALFVVLLFAVLLRVSFLPTPPALSTDIYRYLWDGRVQAHGINPYRYHPAAPELAHLRDPYIYEKINRRDYARTAYPPAAQLVFLLSALIRPDGVTTIKLIFTGFEFIAIAALMLLLKQVGMNQARVLIYAWSPLAVWEIAQNGHVEAVALAFIALAAVAAARGWRAITGVMIALATLVKVYPAMLAAAFYKRWDGRMPAAMIATVAILYAPYLSVGKNVLGFLTHYPKEEGLISGERFLLLKRIHDLAPLPAQVYIVLAAMCFIAAVGYLIWRETGSGGDLLMKQLRGCTLLAGLFLLLVSPQHGWYYLLLLPFLSLTIERVMALEMVGAGAALLSFCRYHLSPGFTPDLLLPPLMIGISLARHPTLQWWWLVLVASAYFLSWV